MDNAEILDSLRNLGYDGLVTDDTKLNAALDHGPSSTDFTGLISWISQFLQDNLQLEERVHPTRGPEDAATFCMEVSGLLQELYCPHSSLTEGPSPERFKTRESCSTLLQYLVSEAEAALMINIEKDSTEKQPEESETAGNLKRILISLGLSKPPPNISPSQLFAKVEQKVKERLEKVPRHTFSDPLLTFPLGEKQWWELHEIHKDLLKDYKLRREVLLKRLDVTILSFTWSGRVKNKLDTVSKIFQPIRNELLTEPNVKICDVLAARKDLAVMEKTSSANVRRKTRTELNRMLIGQVPDRGGRTSEHQAPPPEMPSWQKRQPGSSGGRGRVQGGWNKSKAEDWGQGGKGQEQRGHSGGRGRGGGGRGDKY